MQEIVLGKIRVRHADPRNWVIETLETITSDKGTREDWKIQGFYGTIESALGKLPLKYLDKQSVGSLCEVKHALDKFRVEAIKAIKEVKK